MFELHRNSDTGTKLRYVDDNDEATDILNNNFKHYVTKIQ